VRLEISLSTIINLLLAGRETRTKCHSKHLSVSPAGEWASPTHILMLVCSVLHGLLLLLLLLLMMMLMMMMLTLFFLWHLTRTKRWLAVRNPKAKPP
jgi:hypothetical protein